MKRPASSLLLASAGMALFAFPAHAYTVETDITKNCHERLTMAALRIARSMTVNAAPLPLVTGDDDAMADDLPFSPDADMKDLGAIALVFGARDNDLKGHSGTDLTNLAVVQSDPTAQDEHCLRSFADNEPYGTSDSLAQCQAFILGRFELALAYLDTNGAPTSNQRMGLQVSLAIRGEVTVPLPGFYVAMGQAMHALEDSYAHSYRTSETGPITESLTWLHVADDDDNQAVDGPPHRSEMDECDNLDPPRQAKFSMAEEAASELLLAALGPGTEATRVTRARAVLAHYLAYHSGCSYANQWCDAQESKYAINFINCSMGRGETSSLVAGLVLLTFACLVTRRRRRLPIVLGCASVVCMTGEARADDATSALLAPSSPPRPFPLGVYGAAAESIDDPAMAFSLGVRLRVAPQWMVGLDAEWNPWATIANNSVRLGALDIYATLSHFWLKDPDSFDLHTTLHFGTSTVLYSLFGVPEGTTGVYLGASFLGVDFRLLRTLTLVLEPADIAFPIPQLGSVPFGYLQYRVTVGLQWGAQR